MLLGREGRAMIDMKNRPCFLFFISIVQFIIHLKIARGVNFKCFQYKNDKYLR
jgi:hypothetical protein